MKRDERWDFYKGLLMFSVILGHSITALANGINIVSSIHVFVRTFDMPAFAFISGFFLRKSCREHLFHINMLNKIGSILLPSILWSGIINLIRGINFFSIGNLWFLWSIFCVSCVIIFIDWIGQKAKMMKLLLFIVAIALFHTVIQNPWHIGFLLTPAVIGYYYDETKMQLDEIMKQRAYKYIVVVLFVVCLLFWKPEYNVWNAGCNILAPGAAWKIVFRSFIGIIGWFSMKNVYDWAYDKMDTCRWMLLQRIKVGLVHVGKVTLPMYILQTIFVEYYGYIAVYKVVAFLGWNPFASNHLILTLVFAPIVTACSLIVLAFVNSGIMRIPLFGKYIYGTTWAQIKKIQKKN